MPEAAVISILLSGSLQFLKGDPTDLPAPGVPTVIELWATW